MFTGWIIRRYVRGKPLTRSSAASLQGAVSVVLNILLAAFKVVLAMRLHSLALWADAAHTASDLVTSLSIVAGFRAATLPPDRNHPHGHGRLEDMVTLFVSLALVWSALGLARAGWLRAQAPVAENAAGWMLLVLAGMAAVKEWMARLALHLGKKVDAPALVADAWHHRVDGLAGAAVVVGLLLSNLGYRGVDAFLAMGIAALVARTGAMLCIGAVSRLLGEKPPEHVVETIAHAALAVDGVDHAHGVRVHHYGSRRVVSLNIHVAPQLSVRRSHDIATQVEHGIGDSLPGSEVVVHVEPGTPTA
ncbi:MAG: cation diffusion facilitator family transporter [Bacillota bacterium]